MFFTEHWGTLVQKKQQKSNTILCKLCLTPSYIHDIKWPLCKIQITGEPSRSTFDAQSLLFGARSRHDYGNTIVSFVLLSVRTIWAAKHRTKVHHYAKTSTLLSNRPSDTSDLFWWLSSVSPNHVTWRHFWNWWIVQFRTFHWLSHYGIWTNIP